jgi:ATP-dependent protease ClpP protease subunit
MTSGKIPKNKPQYNESDINYIHNYNIDIPNREIYLHSYFDDGEDENGVNYKSAVMFEKNLRYLNMISLEPILVHMHLPGGDWQDCLGIYDAIKYSKARVAILAYAKVESSSSVLLQAADVRILTPNTNFLMHYGSISVDNEHKAALSMVQWSEKESDKMIEIFTEKCMNSKISQSKNWKKMMIKKHIVTQLATKRDWILSADEAVDYGFADGVLGTKKFPNIDYIKSYCKKI